MVIKNDNLINEIVQIRDKIISKEYLEVNSKLLKKLFSQEPDGIKQSIRYMEYSGVEKEYLENRKVYGLKIKDTDFLVGDIIWYLENNDFRRIIQEEHSELTFSEIKAIQRIITIIISALGCEEYRDESEMKIRKFDSFIKEVERIRDSVIEKGSLNFNKKLFDKQFLWQCSETPDNVESIKHIEYGEVVKKNSKEKIFGIKIIGKDYLISDFIQVLEKQKVREFLLEGWELTMDEIDAIQNVVLEVLKGLECKDI